MVYFGTMKKVLLATACLLAAVALTSSHEEQAKVERTKRAIGGRTFTRGSWPWLALLKATIVTRRLFGIFPTRHHHMYCGGVLVSNQWILSAAHCFTEYGRNGRRASNWEARLGTTRLRAGIRDRIFDFIGRVIDNDAMRIWEVDFDRIVIHPRYNTSGLYTDDIAMIKLSQPIPTSRRFTLIQPISLPGQNETDFPTPGEVCITKGWGCTSRGGGVSSRAMQISMPIQQSSRCHHHFHIPMEKRICAGHDNNGVGACPGDSGSPLVCRRGNTYKLAGLVSLTSRHRPGSYPAVFTSVKDYIPWIQTVMSRY